VIYPTSEGVFTESIGEPYFRLLEGLDITLPAGKAAAQLGIPVSEAAEFLEFAVKEGIVERCAG